MDINQHGWVVWTKWFLILNWDLTGYLKTFIIQYSIEFDILLLIKLVLRMLPSQCYLLIPLKTCRGRWEGTGCATGNMRENWLDSNFSFLKRPITNRNFPQNSILFQWLQKREHWCGISYEINSVMTEVSII